MDAAARALNERLIAFAAQIYRADRVLPVIERDSHAWTRWRQWRLDHGLPIGLMDRMDHWCVPTLEPPDDIAALDLKPAGRRKPGLKAGTREALSRTRKDTP